MRDWRPARSYGGIAATPTCVLGPPDIDKECRRTAVSREPENLGAPGHGAFRAQRERAELSPARTSRSRAARRWPRRLLRSLVLLDSWSPDSHRLSSPQAARSCVRGEWARSG